MNLYVSNTGKDDNTVDGTISKLENFFKYMNSNPRT